jgi:hypothetical protein
MTLRSRFPQQETTDQSLETERFTLGMRLMGYGVISSLPEFEALSLYPLSPAEALWASLHPYLESYGYVLRPRYDPAFTPKLGTEKAQSNPYPFHVSPFALPFSSQLILSL